MVLFSKKNPTNKQQTTQKPSHHLSHLLQYKNVTEHSNNPERLDCESSISGHRHRAGDAHPCCCARHLKQRKPTFMKLSCYAIITHPLSLRIPFLCLSSYVAWPSCWCGFAFTHTDIPPEQRILNLQVLNMQTPEKMENLRISS